MDSLIVTASQMTDWFLAQRICLSAMYPAVCLKHWVQHLASHSVLRQVRKLIDRGVIGRVSLEYQMQTHHTKYQRPHTLSAHDASRVFMMHHEGV